MTFSSRLGTRRLSLFQLDAVGVAGPQTYLINPTGTGAGSGTFGPVTLILASGAFAGTGAGSGSVTLASTLLISPAGVGAGSGAVSAFTLLMNSLAGLGTLLGSAILVNTSGKMDYELNGSVSKTFYLIGRIQLKMPVAYLTVPRIIGGSTLEVVSATEDSKAE